MNDKDALSRIGPVLIDSYFVVDKERKVLSHNGMYAQMQELRGAERKKIIGTACYDSLKLEICQNQCIALQCIEKAAPVRMNEIRGETRSGRSVILELSAIPLRDDSGAISGALVTHREVTDERRLKERFTEETGRHQKERENLLRVIEERDTELERLHQKKSSLPKRR